MPIYNMLIISILFAACSVQNNIQPNQQEMEEGEIIVKVCTRGCYQYLLQTKDETLYFPINLEEDYKNRETIPVLYRGTILESTTDINKPAPTDQPIYDFTAVNIELTHIERRDK